MSPLDNFSREIAEILAEIVSKKGVSQNRIAAASGVSQAQISRILKKQRSVSVEDLHLIAEALGIPASSIFREAESRLSQSAGSSNLVPFPTTPAPILEFTPEIAARAAAKTPPRYRDGYTTEHGIDYDNLGLESQDPQDWE